MCAWPGDEITLFGNAVLRAEAEWHAVLVCADPVDGQTRHEAEECWRESCRALGILPVAALGYPRFRKDQPGVETLTAAISAHVGGYDGIYVPDIQGSSALRRNLCAATGALTNELWMEADTCGGGRVYAIAEAEFAHMIDTVNRCYPQRLRVGRLRVSHLRGARQYRLVRGADMVRFARQFLNWEISGVSDDDPWDLESSAYEQDRYALELEVLKIFPWQSLVEVGGCIGSFTARLQQTFPERHIRVYEPNPHLYSRLHERLGGVVETVHGGAEDVRGECDVLFVSSVLYYLNEFPLRLLQIPRDRLVFSHLRQYHDTTLNPLLRSAGWECEARMELPPRIEQFCGISVRKDGTEAAVWRRTVQLS